MEIGPAMCRVETFPEQTPAGVALTVSKQPVRRARCRQRKQARRARRGMAALLLTMLLAAVLGAAALAWETGVARDRIAGQAALLAEAVAAEGYALHHWLHNNPPVPRPPRGSARLLTGVEITGLEAHAASAPYWRLARGWEVTRLMGLSQAAVAGSRIHGILVLQPPPGFLRREALALLRDEVELRLGVVPPRGSAARLLADTAPTFTLDGGDIVVLAAAFARIDPTVVLRTQRAGFAPPQMAETLDLDGNNLIGAGEIEARTARLLRLRPLAGTPPIQIELTGGLEIRDDLTATGPPTAFATLEVRGGFDSADTLNATDVRANRVTISGTLPRAVLATALVACAAPQGGTCNGGSLDFSAGTGRATWTRLVVFGTAETGRLGGDPPQLPHPDISAGTAAFTTLPAAGQSAPALSGVQSFRCFGCPWLFR